MTADGSNFHKFAMKINGKRDMYASKACGREFQKFNYAPREKKKMSHIKLEKKKFSGRIELAFWKKKRWIAVMQ